MASHPADYRWSSFHCNGLGKPDALISPHDCWLLLGEDDQGRTASYRALFDDALKQTELELIRHSVNTGLPTGNNRFKRDIEKALSIRLGQGKRGRPKKTED